MKQKIFAYISILILLCAFIGCNGVAENKESKQLLQGVWRNAESGERALYVKGDTVYFPDSLNVPMYFRVMDDTLELYGANVDKYGIQRQGKYIFWFTNLNNELVKFRKSENSADSLMFTYKGVQPVIGDAIIKDSVVRLRDEQYHFYVYTQATDNKVLKQRYTSDGIQVDNVYFDNAIRLVVKRGEDVILEQKMEKQDFTKAVPTSFLPQSVLSTVVFDGTKPDGLHFSAVLSIPDEDVSYLVELLVTGKGEYKIIDEK